MMAAAVVAVVVVVVAGVVCALVEAATVAAVGAEAALAPDAVDGGLVFLAPDCAGQFPARL